MKVSCAFAPSPQTPELVATAEELGYAAAWCNDSPALYSDVWMTLGLCAARTTSIGLGVAVSVPSLRHVMTTASSITTLDRLAPARVSVAFGTGLTGRLTLGQSPMGWAEVEAYVVAVRALLDGAEIEWDGSRIRMLHDETRRAHDDGGVELYVAADGPRGIGIATRLGRSVLSTGRLHEATRALDHRALLTFGTVLREGETEESPRVRAAAGPAVAAALHALARRDHVLGRLPGGTGYAAAVDALEPTTRHLTVHEGHLERLNQVDENAWPEASALIRKFTITGSVEQVMARAATYEESGVTELIYQPAGPDLLGELSDMADALGLGARADCHPAAMGPDPL